MIGPGFVMFKTNRILISEVNAAYKWIINIKEDKVNDSNITIRNINTNLEKILIEDWKRSHNEIQG